MCAHLVNRDCWQREALSLKRPCSGARAFHNRLASIYLAHSKLSQCVCVGFMGVTPLFVLEVFGLLLVLKFQIYSRVFLFHLSPYMHDEDA
jgi:hypothetical protein